MTNAGLRLLTATPLAVLVLAGCGGSTDAADDGVTTILASTNVYGDIARAVAGDSASVTSVITSSSQDPHEYEATARDRLALDDADIVIENGGGYDPFIDTLLESGDGDPVVLTAVDLSTSTTENEHVWYDVGAMRTTAEALRDELGELDPANAEAYQANYDELAADLEGLEESMADLAASADGRGVVITEPVPVYLLAEVGLVVQTPEDFSEAVEEGADVAPRVLQETLDLFTTEDVAVLAYNTQASDATTEQVLAAAEGAGVPVVDFTETLPEGQTYVEWQQGNLDNLAGALG